MSMLCCYIWPDAKQPFIASNAFTTMPSLLWPWLVLHVCTSHSNHMGQPERLRMSPLKRTRPSRIPPRTCRSTMRLRPRTLTPSGQRKGRECTQQPCQGPSFRARYDLHDSVHYENEDFQRPIHVTLPETTQQNLTVDLLHHYFTAPIRPGQVRPARANAMTQTPARARLRDQTHRHHRCGCSGTPASSWASFLTEEMGGGWLTSSPALLEPKTCNRMRKTRSP